MTKTYPVVNNCAWTAGSFLLCTCKPQNPTHCTPTPLEGTDDDEIFHVIEGSKWRNDIVHTKHMKLLLCITEPDAGSKKNPNPTYIDDVVIDTIMLNLNAVRKRPIYFLSAKTLAFYAQHGHTQYLMDKFDQASMLNSNSLFVPVNYHNNHWQLLEADFVAEKFTLYDGYRYVLAITTG